MPGMKLQYTFRAGCWRYSGPAGWYFVSLPTRLSKEIRKTLKPEEEGWGRLRLVARVGDTDWKTAIWFDTKLNTYLLPLKAAVRKKESIEAGALLAITLYL